MRSFVLMTGVFKAALLFGVAGISSGALAQAPAC